MPKIAIALAGLALAGGNLFPKPVSAQQQYENCHQYEQALMRYVQLNSPPIGSSNYVYFWTNVVPSYLAERQAENPRCNIYRTREITDEDVRRAGQSRQNQTDQLIEQLFGN